MSDEDFEPFVGGPPPDPSERTWRHPSEIAAQAHADAMAQLAPTNRSRWGISGWRPSSPTNVLIAGSLGTAACLTALALFQVAGSDQTSTQSPDLAGPIGTAEARELDLDTAATATGFPTTTSLPSPSTMVVALSTPPDISPLAAEVAADHLVGIANGTEIIATGVLVDDYLITSASAVGNQLSVSYAQHDRWALAYLVGIDPFSDLAVFRPSVESRVGRTLEALSTNIGDSSTGWDDAPATTGAAEPGDEVISVTLTDRGPESSVGTVLAIEHNGMTSDGQPLIGLIDTSIRRPDRLGSVLIDGDGHMVGIIIDTSSSLASAIPIRDATAIADRLNLQGWANETWIGFVGIDQDDGVEVIDVVDGAPAANAGLRPGDVMRYLDGARIDHMGGITAGLRRAAPGDVIVVVVERSGELLALRIEVSVYVPNMVDGDRQPVDALSTTDGTDAVSESVDG